MALETGSFHRLLSPTYSGVVHFKNKEGKTHAYTIKGRAHLATGDYVLLQLSPLPSFMKKNEVDAYQVIVDREDIEKSRLQKVKDPTLFAAIVHEASLSLNRGENTDVSHRRLPSLGEGEREAAAEEPSPEAPSRQWVAYLLLLLPTLLYLGLFLLCYFAPNFIASLLPQFGNGQWISFVLFLASAAGLPMAVGCFPRYRGELPRFLRGLLIVASIGLSLGLISFYYSIPEYALSATTFMSKESDFMADAIEFGIVVGPFVLLLSALGFLHAKDKGGLGTSVLFYIVLFIGPIVGSLVGMVVAFVLCLALIVVVIMTILAVGGGSSESNKTYKIGGKKAEKTGSNEYRDSSGDTWTETGNGNEVVKKD